MKQDRMETPIYWLLMWSNPQALADLHSLQRRRYGVGITILQQEPEVELEVPIQTNLEEIEREMSKPPSRSRE